MYVHRHTRGVECTPMNGYAGELHKLATHYDIPMVVTPASDHKRLCLSTECALSIVEECIPTDDRLRHDVTDRLLLLRGLVCQVTGLDDRINVAFAHELERLAAQLEHQYGCEGQADEIGQVVRVDHRHDRETIPAVLAFPLKVLVKETIHANNKHLPRLLDNIQHCPSLLPELNAIQELAGVLPAALHTLVGDPRQAADWILTGEHSFFG